MDKYITAQIGLARNNLRYVRIKGLASDSTTAWEKGYYTLTEVYFSHNGVVIPGTLSRLAWINFGGNFTGGDTISCGVDCYLYGSRRLTNTSEWQPYSTELFGGTSKTLEQGYDYQLIVCATSLIGENDVAGALAKYTYTDDTGKNYVLLMDKSNADAIGNPAADPTAVVSMPNRLRPRHIWFLDTPTLRLKRKVIACKPDNGYYKNGGNVSLQAVGGDVTFKATGRVGEKASF